MLKRIFVFVLAGTVFFVGMQFASVFFYAWGFDDFTKDEVRYAPIRENDSTEHLIEHLREQAQKYGLTVGKKDIRISKDINPESGVTSLAVVVNYETPVDLYYFTYPLRRHIHTSTMY